MATTSFGSSTTQIRVGSRRSSLQIRHSSACETFPHTLQNIALAFISTSVSARRRTSTGSAASRWNAIRCAPLGPTPGSRASSSIRSWRTPSYTEAAGQLWARVVSAETTSGERAERAGGELVDPGLAVAVGRHDQVAQIGQGVGVGTVEGAGRDGDVGQLAGAGELDGHAADRALHGRRGELFLRGDQLCLHLLGLLEHGVEVEPALASEAAEGVAVAHLVTPGARVWVLDFMVSRA